MSEKRFRLAEDSNGLYSIFDTEDKEDNPLIYGAEFGTEKIVDLLNELNDENQLLKCALALDAITNISLNDKKVDIPPYYEFENYQQLKKERREEYDEYW